MLKDKQAFIPKICHDFVENYVEGDKQQTKVNLAKNSEMMQVLLQMMSEMRENRDMLMKQQAELTNMYTRSLT
jgi:hypothetical protein